MRHATLFAIRAARAALILAAMAGLLVLAVALAVYGDPSR